MIKKIFLTLFFLLVCIQIDACKCVRNSIAENYNSNEIAGVIRILKIYGNNENERTYKADVEFEKIYKGKKFKTLTIKGLIGMSYSGACELDIEKNERYLILLSKYNGSYIVSSCSSIYRLDKKSTPLEKSKLETLNEAFSYLEKNKFTGLKFTTCYDETEENGKSKFSKIKNFSPKQPFAIYKVKVNDLSKIQEISAITTFGNNDKVIGNIIKTDMTVEIPTSNYLKSKDEFLILLLYRKENENTNTGEIISSEW